MSDEKPIRVMIVDDHGMVRRGLSAYLASESDITVVGEARDGKEAIQICEDEQPEVILMDLIMPELGGVAAIRIINKRWPAIRIVALTSFQEKELVQEALKAGCLLYTSDAADELRSV